MRHLSPSKTALAVGAFLAAWHIVWSIMVALKWGQPIYDFILWALTIAPFDVGATATLVVVASLIGSVAGYLFAVVWNVLHRTTTAQTNVR